MRWVLAVVLASACISYDPALCPDGRICAPGTACVVVTASGSEPTQQHCIVPEQVCDPATVECTLPGGAAAECHDGACLPIGCGNARLDTGETCDDGNQLPGDGCAGDCTSSEACGNGIVDPINSELCDDGNVLSYDGCSSRCTIETPQWTELRSGRPSERVYEGMAYDTARREVVMFGGTRDPTAAPTALGDTWAWDGTAWLERFTVTHPLARSRHTMVYDAAHERVVLFGGKPDSGQPLDDTWTWDGTSWRVETPAVHPPARSSAVMTYDTKRGRVVLFGGQDKLQQPMGDQWEWDGTTWTQVVVSTMPDARYSAEAAYDELRGVTVLYKGLCGAGNCGGVWEYDGAWTHSTANAADILEAALAYDPVLHVVLRMGGIFGGNGRNTVESWNGTQWTTRPMMSAARGRLAAATDANRGVVVFGGTDGSVPAMDDTLVWRGTSWSTADVQTVSVGEGTAAALASASGRVVLAGSFANNAQTWQLRHERWRVIPGAGPPTQRTDLGIAYDAKRDQVIVFGGTTSLGASAETWRLDGSTWTKLSPPTSPLPTPSARIAYDAARDRIVLFGAGIDNDETWLWDGATWTQATPATSPPGRTSHVLAYDPVRQVVVMYGGIVGGGDRDDTWEWNGTTWTQIAVPGPPARREAAFAWNPARRRLTLLGGSSGGGSSEVAETWEWDGVKWVNVVATVGPISRTQAAAAPSPDGNGVVVMGGMLDGGSFVFDLHDTWLLSWRDAGPYEDCRAGTTDRDKDSLAGCADPECWPICAPSCAPGLPCDAAAPRCGDGVANPDLEDCVVCSVDVGACP